MELRAAYKEARNARTVADDAEKSRFAESNRVLLERIEKLEALMTARSDETLAAVRQESVKAEERLKAFGAEQEKRQAEAAARFSEEVTALEKRMQTLLPAPATDDAEAEGDGKKKKEIFKDLF